MLLDENYHSLFQGKLAAGANLCLYVEKDNCLLFETMESNWAAGAIALLVSIDKSFPKYCTAPYRGIDQDI